MASQQPSSSALRWIHTAPIAALVAACGASSQAPASQDTEAPSEEPAESDTTPAEDATASDTAEAPEDGQALESDSENATGSRLIGKREPLNVVYRQTPDGPIIEVAGVQFKPTAKSVKKSDGSFAVQFDVVAASIDGRMHTLLTPQNGPLSIAGSIRSKSKVERFSDDRQGDDEQFIPPDDSLTFTQTWPGKGQPKLLWGQQAKLEVGLWGLGADADPRRPVRKLFAVSTSGTNKASAVIMPPEF